MFIQQKIKILFLLSSLGGGGAQRVISTLIRNLDRRRVVPVLALFRAEGVYIKDIPTDVQIVDLGLRRSRYAFFPVFKTIRAVKPDIVFSCFWNWRHDVAVLLTKLLMFCNRDIKYIARITNTLSEFPKFSRFFYKNFYCYFDMIVYQCEYMKSDAISHFSLPPEKGIVINNPVDMERIVLEATEDHKKNDLYPQNKINLLAVGRLYYQKGYDLLLRALILLDNRYHLTVLGAGSLEKELIEFAKTLGVDDRVDFMGFKDNPYRYMASADLLVLTSRYEGFPNVVLEANACGLPVVAFGIPPVAEIIEDGINGVLVEPDNVEKFAEGIIKAQDIDFDKPTIRAMINSKFNAQKIIGQYEQLFMNEVR